ncbi:hypothetical protein BRE01_37460 [Brevibacillus reuszeri]|uniref:ArpU family transcriptional regulator n=1 Tax=Brevibacillus reuszeri TaxID=54915 RepID=A0ABQ0TR68_9BACL|nr:hypothetical protein BRE01_37460 [Brevibacillus reuszeri]
MRAQIQEQLSFLQPVKYLSTSRVKDINVYLELGLTKDQYYESKKDVIAQIAKALGMI